MRKTIAEHAKEYLESKGYNTVMWGDSALIHEIAELAGVKHNAWRTERNILNALDRSNLFEKHYFLAGFKQQRRCRYFKIVNKS
jgi:2-methylisocitrate lyase-like PEP mutase family enzyme